MRNSIFVFLTLCIAPLLAHAGTCENPTGPSPDHDGQAFLAMTIAAHGPLDDVFPLCGSPKFVTVGNRFPNRYTFDESGRLTSTEQSLGLKTVYEKKLLMYDDAGKLEEIRVLNGNGNITRRSIMKWNGLNSVAEFLVSKDGSVDDKPFCTYTLGVADRTVTIHWRLGGEDVLEYDDRWNMASLRTHGAGSEDGVFEYTRDKRGYLQQQWYTTAAVPREPQYRYSYSRSDANGNPTRINEEVAAIQYGAVNWKPYGDSKRVISYW